MKPNEDTASPLRNSKDFERQAVVVSRCYLQMGDEVPALLGAMRVNLRDAHEASAGQYMALARLAAAAIKAMALIDSIQTRRNDAERVSDGDIS